MTCARWVTHGANRGALAAEAEVALAHAQPAIIHGERHINPSAWRPLIYKFGHYFGLEPERGKTIRAKL